MSNPIVRNFKILGLFGKKNIEINMPLDCSILIGENGLGKTTILSIINFVLDGQFQKLAGYSFSQIDVNIADRYFSFRKEEIESFSLAYDQHSENIDLGILPTLLRILKDTDFNELSKPEVIDIIGRRPFLRRKFRIVRMDRVGDLVDFIKDFQNIFRFIQLRTTLNYRVEYLPTYRRIEADLQKIVDDYRNSRNVKESMLRTSLFEEDDQASLIEHILKDKSSIKFGMKDIDDLLMKFLNRISESSISGFSDVSGGMISKLIEKDFTVKSTEFDKNEVDIVLQRSGNNLSGQEKERIIQMIDNREIYNDKYLVYFLSQLVDVYRRQRVYDISLKGFVAACNEFLVDKKFYYNESLIKIGLYYKDDEKYNKDINLNILSSGEKQLISIMAKVYLNTSADTILLIDEPELSLSINWQKSFLPILLKADKCRQIITVTHSPFIFSNNLADNALGSLEYVRYDK